MPNKKIFAVCCAVALIVVSCSKKSTSHIEASVFSLPRPNSTSFSFPYPLAKLHDLTLDAFSTEQQITNRVFGKLPLTFAAILTVETSTDAVFFRKEFSDLANTNDIYLHSFHTPINISTVYHEQNAGLPFIASFRLHLAASSSDETIVSVTALDTQVIDGERFGVGPCGPGMGNRYETVKPTTVEEYILLRYLGNYLGITNMPAVVVPITN